MISKHRITVINVKELGRNHQASVWDSAVATIGFQIACSSELVVVYTDTTIHVVKNRYSTNIADIPVQIMGIVQSMISLNEAI